MSKTLTKELNEKVMQGYHNIHRKALLEGLPVEERFLDLVGIKTCILEGGEGSTIILLHGPGESSVWWMQIVPDLVRTHHVVIPDLPDHGSSKMLHGSLSGDRIIRWLNELVGITSSSPPILVGHVLGGSIAVRFAVDYQEKINRLVLVDSLGLNKFRPSLRFAFGLVRFMFQPTEKNYDKFLPQCMYDTENLKIQMGEKWDHFIAYNLERANDSDQKSSLKMLMKEYGIPKIPDENLEILKVPTALIWGRHDRANKLKIAESASKRYGWPLYIIEDTRDDPKLEKPEAFIKAFYEFIRKDASKFE
jgi:pimeloyl-ACP methyl ester carboxylesterase